MRRFTESKVGISMANAFSGGVFLSLAFGHMLPHAAHGFENSGLPESTPFYLTLTGYLLIFFVEKIAFDTHEMLHDAHDNGPQSPSTIKPIDSSNSAQVAASGRSATVLLLALSVHSLFETMALGLSTSRLNALLLAMSIGLHQPAESLALLVSFLKTGLPQGKIVKMLALFSCVGPLGVGLGVAAAQYAGDLVDAVLVSLAAGTFVYVGATEVVADEFETPHHKWKKFAALLGGVVLIAYITSWAELLEGRAT
ncbi:ZIP divalent metal transporter [Tribonema minus]|uniref:ZIP divalent metal transporter n=1 Tax=Tribonema minus TaxID=303371 RepID=A0A836CLP2_9STRA|nr:ZIP divalent metal transporter [Tribonema minus]